ncbi:carboxymuconolactone decarboxylase family protein [Peribacillus loiseleuriae]|uniref:Carboxymuconolactone decarboxylase-like domain-containing protein n=1 Tax=Peribacillus loiseleuriae TaxID=1679170 RepID=A0A0K9GSW2_9BACI|nr:carboxymuconolactone decarboxylase family protein [Peribacillus loiseleuriae]KMY49728.1 hypothetical protein AC625_09415 [Peribacillus loiseleuriae]
MSNYTEITKGLTQVARSALEQHRAYRGFSETVWAQGVLPSKEKELIAVGVAHSTKCHYCITHHTQKAKNEGASVDEVIEAAMVAVALEGNSFSLEEATSRLPDLAASPGSEQDPFLHHYEKLFALTYSVFEPKHLSAKLKYLIAIAICFTNKSTHHLDEFISKALATGASPEEIKETYYISALMKAGGTMSYISEAINSYHTNYIY